MSETEDTEMDEQAEETPSSPPPELETPQAGQEVSSSSGALPPDTAPEADAAPEEPPVPPLEPAEPGIYWCEEPYGGQHPILMGIIHQGENDLTEWTNPEQLLAVAALVRDGVLTKMDGQADEPAHESSQR